eukprot:tig00000042_g15394.t1
MASGHAGSAEGAGGDVGFARSRLGTKEHWESAYTRELTNFRETGDPGEIWFEECMGRLMSWMKKNSGFSRDSAVLDIGCGNGHSSVELAKAGFSNVMGTDYVEEAVVLACELAESEGVQARFEVDDILHSKITEQFDIVFDKGTLDAIALNPDLPDPRSTYVQAVRSFVKPDGRLIITSCNFTKDELITSFSSEFQAVGQVDYPVFSFGGSTGSAVVTVVFSPLRR